MRLRRGTTRSRSPRARIDDDHDARSSTAPTAAAPRRWRGHPEPPGAQLRTTVADRIGSSLRVEQAADVRVDPVPVAGRVVEHRVVRADQLQRLVEVAVVGDEDVGDLASATAAPGRASSGCCSRGRDSCVASCCVPLSRDVIAALRAWSSCSSSAPSLMSVANWSLLCDERARDLSGVLRERAQLGVARGDDLRQVGEPGEGRLRRSSGCRGTRPRAP